MKLNRRVLTLIMMAGALFFQAPSGNAGPGGGQSDFLESSRRQDFTGKGTYHRQGLLREQDAAIRLSSANQGKSKSAPKYDAWRWFRDLFRKEPKE